jgi:hypothetical protein
MLEPDQRIGQLSHQIFIPIHIPMLTPILIIHISNETSLHRFTQNHPQPSFPLPTGFQFRISTL